MERFAIPQPANVRADPRAARCCAVVVNYRCAPQTLECVRSLARCAPGLAVLVVENGSGDASESELAAGLASQAQAELLRERENRGFGAGCNRGIEAALERDPSLRHVLLINPDAVATPGFLDELLATAARHPDAGVVGGRVLSMGGERVLYENGRLRPWTLGRSHVPGPAGREEYETEFVTGAFMLIDAGLLRAGLRFDETFFMYVEDLDLCCEVRARGRSLWVNRRAELRHDEGGTQRAEPELVGGLRASQLRHMTRGKVYLARKRFGALHLLVFLVVAGLLKPLAGAVVARSVRFLPAYFAALWEGLRLRPGP